MQLSRTIAPTPSRSGVTRTHQLPVSPVGVPYSDGRMMARQLALASHCALHGYPATFVDAALRALLLAPGADAHPHPSGSPTMLSPSSSRVHRPHHRIGTRCQCAVTDAAAAAARGSAPVVGPASIHMSPANLEQVESHYPQQLDTRLPQHPLQKTYGQTGQPQQQHCLSAFHSSEPEVQAWRHSTQPPAPGCVQLWWAPLDQATTCRPDRTAAYRACLPPAEAEEIAGPGQQQQQQAQAQQQQAQQQQQTSQHLEQPQSHPQAQQQHPNQLQPQHSKPQPPHAEVAAKRLAARALARCVLARAVSDAGEVAGAEDEGGGDSSTGNGGGVAGGRMAGSANSSTDSSSSSSERLGSSSGGGAERWGGRGVVQPQDLELRRGPHGKPHLLPRPGWPTLRHNLTHTQDIAGLALLREPCPAQQHSHLSQPAASMTSSGCTSSSTAAHAVHHRLSYSIGLDVERLDRVPRDPLSLARRRLAAAEVRALEELSGEERNRHFMWLWTLKEAYVKARGTGISAPPGLKGFAIGFEDMSAPQLRELSAASRGSCSVSPAAKIITFQHTACAATAAPSSASAASAASSSSSPPSAFNSANSSSNSSGGGLYSCSSQSSSGTSSSLVSPLLEQPYGDPATRESQWPPAATSDAAATQDEWEVGSEAHYSFLLFQPTPLHVAALCVAVQPSPLQPQQQLQPQLQLQQLHGRDQTQKRTVCVNSSCNGVLGLGGIQGGMGPILGAASALSSVVVGRQQRGSRDEEAEAHEGRVGAFLSGAGPLPPWLVEHWWCVPLAAEGRLRASDVTLLGASL